MDLSSDLRGLDINSHQGIDLQVLSFLAKKIKLSRAS
jgi:hypothetical protein